MANDRDLRLNIVTTADSKGLTKAAKDLGDTRAEADKLGKSFDELGDNAEQVEQSLSKTTKGVRDHKEQIKLLRAEYEKTTRKIADLDAQLLGGGDSKQIRKDLREQRSFLAEIRRVAKEVERSSGIKFSLGGGGPVPSPAGGLGAIAGMPTPVVAGLVAAASAAGPAIGSIIGGAIIGAVGTGGMAVGLLSAAKNTEVQAAAKSFGQTISAEFFQGDAFVKPAIEGLQILQDAFRDMNLDETLAKAAPTVVTMAEGLAKFGKGLMPGLDKTLERIGPFADAASQGIGDLGDAFGDMIDMISSSKGSVDGINTLFAALGGTLRFVGAEIKFLGDRWHEIINVAGMFTSIGAHTGFENLDKGIRQLTGHSGKLQGELQFLGSTTGQAAAMANEHHRALLLEHTELVAAERKTRDLADAQAQAALSARDLNAAWKELHGGQMTLDEALQSAYDGLERVKSAFAGPDDSVTGDSQGAVGRRLALEQEATAAIAVAQAYLDMTGDTAGAQAKLDEFKVSAEKATGATGAARKKVDELADALFRLPPKREVYVTTYLRTVEGTFRADERGTLGATQIDTRATGGPVTAGMPYIVGDGGRPELFVPKQDGMILPSVPSGNGGQFSGSVRTVAPLVLNFPTGSMEAALIETIRSAVAARGGTLAVLGLRS
jgi:hypothetical protein